MPSHPSSSDYGSWPEMPSTPPPPPPQQSEDYGSFPSTTPPASPPQSTDYGSFPSSPPLPPQSHSPTIPSPTPDAGFATERWEPPPPSSPYVSPSLGWHDYLEEQGEARGSGEGGEGEKGEEEGDDDDDEEEEGEEGKEKEEEEEEGGGEDGEEEEGGERMRRATF